MNNTGFSMLRTSYGLKDDNNDGVPAPGSVNLGLIRTDRAMFGDTITAIFSGNVLGGSFPYLYAQSSITNGNDYLTFLDGLITITRGATVYTCNVAAPVVNNTGSTRTFRFDLSTSVLIASGCVPGGFTFQSNDVIEFRSRYRVYRNPGGAILTCDVTNEFYNSNVPNPSNAADKLWCNNYTAAFSIIGYYYTNWGPNSISVSSCNQVTVSQNYYLSIGPCCQQYAGGNLFPFEYRRWAWPKNLIVTPPAGYKFVSARFNHVRTAGNGVISSTAWQVVTPVNPNGPVFDFYVEPYFSQFGGPFQESDDGFYGTLEVTFIPSCEVSQHVAASVAYDWYFGESPILQGSNTGNRVFVNTQDYLTYQGPDLFIQSSLPTVLAQDRSVSWDVSLSNTTNVSAHQVFIAAPVISGVTVTEVFDVTNNVVVAPTAGGIYQLGQIAANSIRNLRITASFTSCATDSIIIHAGWNCVNYPIDLASYPCVTDKIKLKLTPQIPTLIANITSPSGTVDLCDTATYTVEGVNIQLGTAYDLKLRVILPAGVSIVSGSSFMSYPPGAPFVPIPAPLFISGTTYEWDLSALHPTLANDGLKGILQNTLNTVKVRFRVRTDCMYTSGSLIGFIFHGRSACGLYTGQEVTLSSQLAITGATKPYETRVDLISTYISPCSNSTLMTVNVVNNGPLPSGPADSVIIVLPQGVRFVNGSYTGIYNAPPNNTFVTYMLNNRQYIQWKLPQHIVAGDSVRFSFRFEADAFSLDCNIQNFEAYTVSNKNLLCVLNGQQCGINVRTGDTILPMYVYKAYLSITALEATAVQNAPTGETLNIQSGLLNVGENIAAGNKIIIDFYRDADGNGQLSAADVLLGKDTINSGINTNATVSNTTILNVPAGFGCNVIAVLNPIHNGCICNMTQRFTGNIPLFNAGSDQSVCSGSIVQLGTQGVNNYQYSWIPSAGLSNPNSNVTAFSMQNQSGNNLILQYRLVTNRIHCTSSDTVEITVFPETNVSFSGLNAAYCSNEASSILTGTPLGGTFSGAGISANVFNPSVAGYGVKNIIYTYTDINNCTWRDTQQTTIRSAPQATISGLMTDYCIDAPDVVMTALPGGGAFSGNGILSGNIFSPSAAGAGQHTISYAYTDANQCSDTAIHLVTVRPLPSVGFSGLNAQYCENDTVVTLTPQPPGGVFSGTGINNGNQFDPGLSGGGNFRIIYTYRDVYQCQNSDTQWVAVHPVVTAVFSGLQSQYCIDAPAVTLTATPSGGTFGGNGISGNNFLPSAAGAGNHMIYYIFTDTNNCISVDSQTVRINDLPEVHFTGLASAYCVDDAIAHLQGNQPTGIFSGNGIAGARFIPAAAGTGAHTIIYSYTDANGCFNADTQLTVVHGLPVVTFSGLEPGYCADAAAVYLTGNPPGGIFSGNGINANYFVPSDAGSGRHSITYTYTDTNNCSNFSTQEVAVYPAPLVNANIRSISCFGANDGSIVLHITDGTAPFDIQWNNGMYSGQHLVSLSPGNYALMLTDANGCTFSDIYTINEPQPLVSSFEKTDVTCHGDADGTAVFTVNGGTPPYSFSWNNGSADAGAYSLPAGTYSVTITDAHGCQNMHGFSITQPNPIWIQAMPAIDSVFRGNSVQITTEYYANNLFVTYQWTPADGLNCSRCARPIATPDATTQYTVTMTDETGCVASASVWIVVKDEHVYYAPNIFSPNGDGINDLFQIFVKGTREFHLQIHDRWGELVFRSDNPNAAWNGTLNGRELPDGVYVYDVYVIYQDGVVYKKKGSITLVR